jgi:hypothetical protein
MANALADTLAPPDAPNPAAQQSGPTASAGGNALASLLGGGAQAGAPQQPPQMPAPTHAQTVAALRHFQTIGKELEGLLLNPDIGKTDIRSAIIDAVTRLVSERIISPAQAVQQLGQVPDRPFDQKQAIEQMYKQTMMAEAAVLDHHGMSNAPLSEDFNTENSLYQSDPDQHQQTIAQMMQAHYSPQGPQVNG